MKDYWFTISDIFAKAKTTGDYTFCVIFTTLYTLALPFALCAQLCGKDEGF